MEKKNKRRYIKTEKKGIKGMKSNLAFRPNEIETWTSETSIFERNAHRTCAMHSTSYTQHTKVTWHFALLQY